MTYEYPIKCLSCGLHYTIWSWDTDWHEKHTAHCPECGLDEHFVAFPVRDHPEQVYEVVPGATLKVAPLRDLGVQDLGDGSLQMPDLKPGSTTINYS